MLSRSTRAKALRHATAKAGGERTRLQACAQAGRQVGWPAAQLAAKLNIHRYSGFWDAKRKGENSFDWTGAQTNQQTDAKQRKACTRRSTWTLGGKDPWILRMAVATASTLNALKTEETHARKHASARTHTCAHVSGKGPPVRKRRPTPPPHHL
eukprot:5082984-Pleurochrysis_carterae.AAC.2